MFDPRKRAVGLDEGNLGDNPAAGQAAGEIAPDTVSPLDVEAVAALFAQLQREERLTQLLRGAEQAHGLARQYQETARHFLRAARTAKQLGDAVIGHRFLRQAREARDRARECRHFARRCKRRAEEVAYLRRLSPASAAAAVFDRPRRRRPLSVSANSIAFSA
jgi:hypothetical protein